MKWYKLMVKECKKIYNDAYFLSIYNQESIEIFYEQNQKPILGDILVYGSRVLLVVPIDSEAPKRSNYISISTSSMRMFRSWC